MSFLATTARKLLVAFTPAVLVIGLFGSAPVSAAARQALIDGATVVESPSQEEQIATAAGFNVTVVDDATWASMTAAQFGAYDLLIVGDPSCDNVPDGVI